MVAGDRVEWLEPVFKLVPLEFAESVERGCLRIGNLRDYANHENESRRDAAENTIARKVTYLDSALPHHRNYLERLNIFRVENGARLQISDLTVVEEGPNHYCLCFSKSLEDLKGFEGAVFEISDPLSLAIELRRENRCLREFWLSSVSYEKREITIYDKDIGFSPMVKDVGFAHENEVRILWNARRPDCPPVIIAQPAVQIANLLKRVR